MILERVRTQQKRDYSTTTRELGLCQVRSRTDRPCPFAAAVKIQGVPFCERCARDQEAYFAIGELTDNLGGDQPLVGMPDPARWELVRRIGRARK